MITDNLIELKNYNPFLVLDPIKLNSKLCSNITHVKTYEWRMTVFHDFNTCILNTPKGSIYTYRASKHKNKQRYLIYRVIPIGIN